MSEGNWYSIDSKLSIQEKHVKTFILKRVVYISLETFNDQDGNVKHNIMKADV